MSDPTQPPTLLAPQPSEALELGPVPSISVVIPVYKAAATLPEALTSVLEQTAPPAELIVIDDGSPDDIATAVQPFGARVTLLRHERNRGASAARNTGIQQARGELVAFHDADDVFLPGRLEAIGAAAAARPDLDILVADEYIEVDGRRLRRAYDESWEFETADQRQGILERCFILHGTVKREALVEIGGFDGEGPLGERVTDDWDLYLRLIFAGSRAGMIPEPLGCYRVTPDSLSADRAGIERSKLLTLERARRELSLSAAERATLEATLAAQRRTTAVEDAKRALLEGAPDLRRRSLAIARSRGYGARTRLKSAGVVIAPGIAQRMLAARSRRAWSGAAGVRVRGESE
jgi:hypothetical protein